MNKHVKYALWGVLLAGGVSLLGTSAANAAETDGSDGLLSGTQIIAPVTAPITAVGNAVSVLDTSAIDSTPDAAPAASTSAPAPAPAPAPAAETNGDDSVASGTQAVVGLDVPVNVSGNAVSVLDSASAQSTETASAQEAAPAPAAKTSGSDGLLSGTQGIVSADVPVNVTGNAISVFGDADASSDGGQAAGMAPAPDATTDGSDGILGGTQLLAPVTAPVNITGNGISVLGDADANGDSMGSWTEWAFIGGETGSDNALLGGTQILLPVTAPIAIGGNTVSVVGDGGLEVPGTTPGTDTGSEPGNDPSTEPGTGADAGTGVGTGTGAEPGAIPGAASDTDADADGVTSPRHYVLASASGSTTLAMTGSGDEASALAMTGGGNMAPALALLAGSMLLIGGSLIRRGRMA
ncbi:chaplin family protein [Microbacterium sp. NPDC089318]